MTRIDLSFMPFSEQVQEVKNYLESRTQHKTQGDIKLKQVMAHFKHKDLGDPKSKHAYLKKLYLVALGKLDENADILTIKTTKQLKRKYSPFRKINETKNEEEMDIPGKKKEFASNKPKYGSAPGKKTGPSNKIKSIFGFKPKVNNQTAPPKDKQEVKPAAQTESQKSRKEKIKERKLNNASPPLYADVKPFVKKTGPRPPQRKNNSGVFILDGNKTYGGVYRDESETNRNAPKKKKRGGFSDNKYRKAGGYNQGNGKKSF